MMDWQLVYPLLAKAADLWQTPVEIINQEGLVVASSDPTRLNLLCQDIKQRDARGKKLICGNYLPIAFNESQKYWLHWEGQLTEKEIALLKATLEEITSTRKFNLKGTFSNKKNEEKLLSVILDGELAYREEDLKLWALDLGYDLDLPRTMIVIKFEPKENRYFNINLHLGYDFVQEQIKAKIKHQFCNDIHITKQDIVSFYGKNMLIICKAFLDTNNLPRIYQALDVICTHFYNSIHNNRIFNFIISYGSVKSGVTNLRQSYLEALDILDLGIYYGSHFGFINDDDFLFEFLVNALPQRLIARHIEPLYHKIAALGENAKQLLQTLEVYINNNMNIKSTAAQLYIHRNTVTNHLEKIAQLTGIDPNAGFKNVFWLKMLIVYFRLKNVVVTGGENEVS